VTAVPTALEAREPVRGHANARQTVRARPVIAPYIRRIVDPPRLKFLSRSKCVESQLCRTVPCPCRVRRYPWIGRRVCAGFAEDSNDKHVHIRQCSGSCERGGDAGIRSDGTAGPAELTRFDALPVVRASTGHRQGFSQSRIS
jgi:hypothetical protein